VSLDLRIDSKKERAGGLKNKQYMVTKCHNHKNDNRNANFTKKFGNGKTFVH
jgi:hypothetical protein